MKLELTKIRPASIIDDDTLSDYYLYRGETVKRLNRDLYEGSQGFTEMNLEGYLYAYHNFIEEGKNFATLTPYKKNIKPCSKRTYRFGCINTNTNTVYYFFRGKNLGKSRQQAIQVYNELKAYCDAQGEVLLAFAMKS